MKTKTTLFIQKVGDSDLMQILEIFIEFRGIPFQKIDIYRDLKLYHPISNAKYKETFQELIQNNYIKCVDKKRKLYILNQENEYVKSFTLIFDLEIKKQLIKIIKGEKQK